MKQSFAKHCLKVLLLGDSSVGKTSILNRYVKEEFSQSYRATIGCDFLQKELQFGEEFITLQIWDTAGQERFRSVGNSFYRGSDCLVLVYDITNQQSFESLVKWKQEFFDILGCNDDFPVMILGNKMDLELQRSVSKSEAEQFANEHNALFFETSARANVQVEEAFADLAQKALQLSKDAVSQRQEYGVVLNATVQSSAPAKKQSKCC